MMLAKGSCVVNPDHFRNDLHDIRSKNDVLSVLVHLGYLTYDQSSGACRIPNREVSLEFEMAIRDSAEWGDVAAALQQSEQLLRWTLAGEEKRVADAIDKIHADSTSILKYNDENSLACVLTIAYYAAMNTYRRVRELPSGNGFADIVLVPKKHVKSPAIVLELKYDHTAESAINQIKRQRYADALVDYVGEVVLVGVNYDKDTKVHSCVIERVKKGDATSGSVYSLRAKVSIALEKSVYSSQESVYGRKELCPAISTRLWGKAMLLIRLLALHEELSVVELRTFVPKVEVLEKYGVKPKEYMFLREVSVGTINYAGQASGAILGIKDMIPTDMRVLFSLEEKKRRDEYPADWILLQEPIEDIHSLIYYAAGLVSSGDSMAREAALLGVPSYYLGIRYSMPANAAASKVASLQNRQTMDFGAWIANVNELMSEGVNELTNHQTSLRKHIDDEFIDINEYMLSLVENVNNE